MSRPTVASLLRAATTSLASAGIPDAARDARALLAHAMGVEAARLTLILPDAVDPAAAARFGTLVQRRVARVPVAQLIGRRCFWGRDFIVTADVLDPRPETEVLVAAALEAPFLRVLDLGTGTGCILLTLLAERPAANGLGVDLSPAACDVARRNAQALALNDRAEIRQGDWAAGVSGPFDLIVANPPYIAADEMPGLAPEVRLREPHLALTDGGDGLGAYRAIMAQAPGLLAPGGRLLVEIGPAQGASVAGLMAAAGLDGVAILPDLDGRDRVVAGRAMAANPCR
ncbi:MAG: peptide chain release factor N(5)-glutamine methyltransferase [Limimaricola sp.]|uniref:peptide chain release factor N(5)-glutamine methyltransferase n=1 Tax=Limimaricola sp. TaxID=2211665 RepID=UPI001DFAD877|nr:peptide chain release factor N(5)-glutamine methyltransferase [Limimaricola sp.]MBI1418296.1 peptide chain release factor N(5)-glutamine methyltransferase [Limimaricola sp.]